MSVPSLRVWIHRKWIRAKYRYRLRGVLLRLTILVAIVMFLALAVGAGGAGPAAEFSNSVDDNDRFNQESIENQFIGHLNEERRARGLQPVEQRDELTELGNAHTQDMVSREFYSHTNPDGQSISDRYKNHGLLPECRLEASNGEYYLGAENLYEVDVDAPIQHRGDRIRLSDESVIARFLFEGWMDSPGHRDAMLVHSASEAGLGISISEDGTFYAALELC